MASSSRESGGRPLQCQFGFGFLASLLFTVILVFGIQMLIGGSGEFVDIRDYTSALAKGNRKAMTSKTVLKNMAFELSSMREKSGQDVLSLRETLDSLQSSDKEQVKATGALFESLSTKVIEQRELLERQQKLTSDVLELLQRQETEIGDIRKQQEKLLDTHQHEFQDLKLNSHLHDNALKARGGLPMIGYLTHGDPSEWKQRSFSHHGTFGFILYSTYRLAPNKFVSTGLGALKFRDERKLDGCTWHGKDGSIVTGKLEFLHQNEHHYMKYEILVVSCTLDSDTSKNGGYLIASIDFEDVVFINEDFAPDTKEPETFESQFAICGPPLFSPLEARSVWEWMEYSRVILGVDKFVFYDLGVLDSDVIGRLGDYIDSGMLEIEFLESSVPYEVWYYGQGILSHDCMFRMRLRSKWLMMVDLDEYVQPLAPNTMASLLHKYSDRPWLTHQAKWWSLEHCNSESAAEEGEERFGIERMVFTWPSNYCQDKKKYPDTNYCLSDKGHRKFIVNPRKVDYLAIHHIIIPETGGVDLNVNTELRHNHFQGLNAKGRKVKNLQFCRFPHDDGEKVDWWSKDYSAAVLGQYVRGCSFANNTACGHKIE